MRQIKFISFSILSFIAMTSFSQCSGSKKISENPPINIGKVYCQKWIAGVEGGGSGLDLYIPVEEDIKLELDSVYFRNRAAKLEYKAVSKLYVGRFKDSFNLKKDMVMSGEKTEEFGNTLPEFPEKIPFDLKENECIVSYTDANRKKYFKITGIEEKALLAYPSAPPNKQ